jgi:hypothetical protein
LQRQDRLRAAIAALLGGATGRVTLDDENLGQRRVFLLAVGELAGQAGDVERAFASRQFARLARRFARPRGFDDLADDGLGFTGVLEQELGRASQRPPSRRRRFTSDETSLSLVCDENFGSGTFTDRIAVKPSRACRRRWSATFSRLGDAFSFDVVVERAGECGAEAA